MVDDGSTDGTAEVLQPWLEDPRVRCISRRHNAGLGAALNPDWLRLGPRWWAPIGRSLLRGAPRVARHPPGEHATRRQPPPTCIGPKEPRSNRPCSSSRLSTGVPLGGGSSALSWIRRSRAHVLAPASGRRPVVHTGRATSVWTEHPHQLSRHIRESPVAGSTRSGRVTGLPIRCGSIPARGSWSTRACCTGGSGRGLQPRQSRTAFASCSWGNWPTTRAGCWPPAARPVGRTGEVRRSGRAGHHLRPAQLAGRCLRS